MPVVAPDAGGDLIRSPSHALNQPELQGRIRTALGFPIVCRQSKEAAEQDDLRRLQSTYLRKHAVWKLPWLWLCRALSDDAG